MAWPVTSWCHKSLQSLKWRTSVFDKKFVWKLWIPFSKRSASLWNYVTSGTFGNKQSLDFRMGGKSSVSRDLKKGLPKSQGILNEEYSNQWHNPIPPRQFHHHIYPRPTNRTAASGYLCNRAFHDNTVRTSQRAYHEYHLPLDHTVCDLTDEWEKHAVRIPCPDARN